MWKVAHIVLGWKEHGFGSGIWLVELWEDDEGFGDAYMEIQPSLPKGVQPIQGVNKWRKFLLWQKFSKRRRLVKHLRGLVDGAISISKIGATSGSPLKKPSGRCATSGSLLKKASGKGTTVELREKLCKECIADKEEGVDVWGSDKKVSEFVYIIARLLMESYVHQCSR